MEDVEGTTEENESAAVSVPDVPEIGNADSDAIDFEHPDKRIELRTEAEQMAELESKRAKAERAEAETGETGESAPSEGSDGASENAGDSERKSPLDEVRAFFTKFMSQRR